MDYNSDKMHYEKILQFPVAFTRKLIIVEISYLLPLLRYWGCFKNALLCNLQLPTVLFLFNVHLLLLSGTFFEENFLNIDPFSLSFSLLSSQF